MHRLISTLLGVIERIGYPGIVLGMFLESSFFPFPSEVIVPPAGYLASQGRMSLWLVVLSGLSGSLLGALFNYWISLKLGRPLLLRLGRYLGLTERRYARAEDHFRRHGEISTFIGRLIPGLRQYISLPAGLARMDLGRFVLFTALGAGIWTAILACLGYLIGENEALLRRSLREIMIYTGIAVAIIVSVYILWHRRTLSPGSGTRGDGGEESE